MVNSNCKRPKGLDVSLLPKVAEMVPPRCTVLDRKAECRSLGGRSAQPYQTIALGTRDA